jgi:hypothetical protein
VDLMPRTVQLIAATEPAGLTVALDGDVGASPLSATAIQGSTHTVSTTSPQVIGAATYEWGSWSDGGAINHNLAVGADRTVVASFAQAPPRDDGPAVTEPQPTPVPPASDPIALEVLRVKIPSRAKKLVNKGSKALVRCSHACSATMQLVGEGRAAQRLGIDGILGAGTVSLPAGTGGWVSVDLGGRARKRLLRLGNGQTPRIVGRFAATPAEG